MTTTQTSDTDTYQDVETYPLQRISLTLLHGGEAELLVEIAQGNDTSKVDYGLAHMNKEQMWEHIHNCLTIMEGMK